jgi:membrane fusion protein, multidrug efflux system
MEQDEKTILTKTTGKKNNHKKKLIIAVLLVIALVGAGYHLWTRDKISTDDAYVDGHIYSIAPRISGYVTQIFVEDNQEVEKDQILLTLDPTPFEVALAEAKAALAEAVATLISMDLGVPLELNQTDQRVRAAKEALRSMSNTQEKAQKEEEAARQEIERARAENQKALLDLNRIQELLKNKSVPQATLDQAKTQYDMTLAMVHSANAKWEAQKKQSESTTADMAQQKANIELAATGKDLAEIKSRQVKAQQARVDLAKARVKQAELELGYTNVKSPTDGFITKKSAEPGRTVSVGQPLMAVVPLNPEELWVTANCKETQLTDVKSGQQVDIEVDTYPGIRLQGKVDSIMAGTGAVFSLFPPENASGNFVKVVQRIPVKITLTPGHPDDLPVLRIGMSVVPTIHTGK